ASARSCGWRRTTSARRPATARWPGNGSPNGWKRRCAPTARVMRPALRRRHGLVVWKPSVEGASRSGSVVVRSRATTAIDAIPPPVDGDQRDEERDGDPTELVDRALLGWPLEGGRRFRPRLAGEHVEPGQREACRAADGEQPSRAAPAGRDARGEPG